MIGLQRRQGYFVVPPGCAGSSSITVPTAASVPNTPRQPHQPSASPLRFAPPGLVDRNRDRYPISGVPSVSSRAWRRRSWEEQPNWLAWCHGDKNQHSELDDRRWLNCGRIAASSSLPSSPLAAQIRGRRRECLGELVTRLGDCARSTARNTRLVRGNPRGPPCNAFWLFSLMSTSRLMEHGGTSPASESRYHILNCPDDHLCPILKKNSHGTPVAFYTTTRHLPGEPARGRCRGLPAATV